MTMLVQFNAAATCDDLRLCRLTYRKSPLLFNQPMAQRLPESIRPLLG